MIRSLFSGITALQTQSQAMGVIGDNIANVSTQSFKGARVDFANLLNQSVGGYTGQEVGSGVSMGKLSRNWGQGSVNSTSNVTDIAINGNGMFIVQDPGGTDYYTRAGMFHFTEQGYLVDNNNYNVMSGDGTAKTIDPDFATTMSYEILSDGTINRFAAGDTTGTALATGKIALATFPSNWGLASTGMNMYKATGNSGTAVIGAPEASGKGSLTNYALEMSNVDLATEFGKMITTQRSFQAATKVITASDEILQQLLAIKR